LLKAALGKAKLGDITKKITFSQDADGRIIIEGNIGKDQKERLAKTINEDSELSELIKTQSAKKAVLAELKESITDEPTLYKSPSAWKKYSARPAGFDLSKDSLASAREQLLKNFLEKSGVSKDELGDLDAVFTQHEELGDIKGLRNEINALLMAESKKTETTEAKPQPLLAMKRGELVETIGGDGIDEGISDLKQRLNYWIGQYNKVSVGTSGQPGLMITGYTVTLDHNGRANIEMKTADGDPQSAQIAMHYLMADARFFVKPDSFDDLGLAILDAHDDEHGDVKEYKHSVVIESGKSGYRIESPEADQAAMKEMEELTQDLGSALEKFFGETLKIKNPFTMTFGSDGFLSFEGNALTSMESDAVKKVLDDINRYFAAKNAGEDTEGMLPDELTTIGEKLLAVKEVQDKIHDKSLLPKEKEGVRWGM
jgi:hypothetical protein